LVLHDSFQIKDGTGCTRVSHAAYQQALGRWARVPRPVCRRGSGARLLLQTVDRQSSPHPH
jgi:hypothetical protein